MMLSVILFFCVAVHADAQAVRPEAKGSNLIISAVDRYNERNIDEALTLLKEAVAENPDDDAAWYYLAQCAIAKNDAEMAEQGLRMAAELDPDNFWYRYPRRVICISIWSRCMLPSVTFRRRLIP